MKKLFVFAVVVSVSIGISVNKLQAAESVPCESLRPVTKFILIQKSIIKDTIVKNKKIDGDRRSTDLCQNDNAKLLNSFSDKAIAITNCLIANHMSDLNIVANFDELIKAKEIEKLLPENRTVINGVACVDLDRSLAKADAVLEEIERISSEYQENK